MAVLADGWRWVDPNWMKVVQKAWFSKFAFLFYMVRKCCGGVFLCVLANKPEQSEAGGRHQVSPLSTYVCRVQRSVWRLLKYWPPSHLSTQRVCPPPHQRRGGTHSLGGEGWVVNIFNILEDARHWIGLLQYNRSTRWAKFTNRNTGTTRIAAAVRTCQTWTWLIYVVDPLI